MNMGGQDLRVSPWKRIIIIAACLAGCTTQHDTHEALAPSSRPSQECFLRVCPLPVKPPRNEVKRTIQLPRWQQEAGAALFLLCLFLIWAPLYEHECKDNPPASNPATTATTTTNLFWNLWKKVTVAPAVDAAANAQRAEDFRMRYVDAGEWARHFSVVRMTVSTFLIGLAAGIVSFKWDQGEVIFLYMSLVVWIAAVVIFWVFSELEHEAVQRQACLSRQIQPKRTKPAPGRAKDGGRWIMLLLTIAFGCLWVMWARK